MEFRYLPGIKTKIRFRIASLSLKGRLSIVFSVLMCIAICFAMILMFRQHQISVNGANMAIRAHEDMSIAIEVREALVEVDRQSKMGEFPTVEIGQFYSKLKILESRPFSPSFYKVIHQTRRAFDSYINILSKYLSDPTKLPHSLEMIRSRYEDTAASVGTFIEMSESSVYSLAEDLQRQQKDSIQLALILLCVFMLMVLAASFRMISIFTNPISDLATYLDNVNVEDDLPSVLPDFRSDVPEVAVVASSFERLFQRLRGYRALNIRRLLIEKRRADIIAASISDGIFLLRGDEIVYVNPVAEKILGITPGKFRKGLKLGGDSSAQNTAGMQAVSKAVSRIFPVEFVLEDEKKFYYLIQSCALSNDLIEKVEHSVGNSVDQILDRFQANILVLAQNVTLVKESQEAKGHFIATLSHEVKTPVTSLTMATRLLKKSIDQIENPMCRNLILTCVEDVDRLRSLLDDLMTISRFDTLTQRLEIQKIDIGKLLIHSIHSFQPQAREKGVELNYQTINSGKPIIVPMDPTKISWALSNLITNALRHTPRGGKVEACVEICDDLAQVRIRDTGPGIDRYRQERIFDKFNPYYDLRVARSGSVGAGLAIAKEIVMAHGGRIWVSSEVGQGAAFCFALPLKRASTPAFSEDSVSKPLSKMIERLNEKSRYSL